MNELIAKVLQWGIDKGITGPNGTGTLLAQAKKMREECLETFDAATHCHYVDVPHSADWEALIDGIGDLHVTGILLAELAGLTTEECLQHAYDVISKRSGIMVNGTFVKDDPDLYPVIEKDPNWKAPPWENNNCLDKDDDLNEPLGQACQLGDETCESCQ